MRRSSLRHAAVALSAVHTRFCIAVLLSAIAVALGLAGCGSGTTPRNHAAGAPKRLACFAAPGACGYPDPKYHTAGAKSPCSSLPSSGPITTSTDGQTIADLNVTGTITVQNRGVTIRNVCVTADGGGQINSAAISLQGAARNTLIEYATIAGANDSNHSVEAAVVNRNGGRARLSYSYLHFCGECIHDSWSANDSYVLSDGMQGTTDHVEAVYFDSPGGGRFNHDVLLNPWPQTAVIFGDNVAGGACASQLTLTNSLIAGGALSIWTCGGMKSTGVGSSTINISHNDWARCTTRPLVRSSANGGTTCRGNVGTAIGAGADSHGYWPLVGYEWATNLQYCPPVRHQVFADNWYDDTGAPVKCPNPWGPQKEAR
jgi:hypothetical protein